MYGYVRRRGSFLAPAGIGFGRVWLPLPTPTSRFLPSGVTATAVGYHPVGMKPRTWLRSTLAMSMTATQLLSPLATKSVLPSGATATASGVLPSGALGKRAVMIVSVTTPRWLSMTDTQLLEAHATNSRSSPGWLAIWLGWSPTPIRATTRRSSGFKASTVRLAQSET